MIKIPYLAQERDKLAILLRGYGLTSVQLGAILRVSRQTAAKRLADPDTLTRGELKTISRKAHIPIDEIRSAL